jgi:hypothetical protein
MNLKNKLKETYKSNSINTKRTRIKKKPQEGPEKTE